MSINQSINQYYCDNFHVQNLFPEYLYLVGEIFTSRSPSDPDVTQVGRQPKNKGVKNELNKVAAHQTIDCEYYAFVPRLVQLLTDENFHTLQINLDFFPLQT